MQRLEQRIQRLEADSPANYTVIHIRSFAGVIDEPVRIVGAAAEWHRAPGESVETFRRRSSLGPHQAGRNGVVVLKEHNRTGMTHGNA